jgi:acyl carrier protein
MSSHPTSEPGTTTELAQFAALVRRHIARRDEFADLPMDASMDELGLDSVAALNLMLDLEETFGVTFPPSMYTEDTFASPTALWRAVSSLRLG